MGLAGLAHIHKGILVWCNGVVDIDAYKGKRFHKRDSKSMYEQGLFKVSDIGKGGYVAFEKNGRMFKVLYRPSQLCRFSVGDTFKGTLRRKIFFEYWEWLYIDNIKENIKSGEQQRLEI